MQGDIFIDILKKGDLLFYCFVFIILPQQKKRCPALEELLAGLIVIAMERSENETENDKSNQLLWQHLSSQLIFFVLFQFASFPHMVNLLHEKVC